jgi:molybdate transport system ATP-binding protein
VGPLNIRVSHPLRAFRLEVTLAIGSETVALVGPSGAGKTTLLRAVAGLLRPEHGSVAIGGDVWLDTTTGVCLPPEKRSVGLVFQEYALFPHMTVSENVAYGGRARADELLARFGLGSLARARPAKLSGGERQRVALARALAREPSVLLLDEPLAALDTQTRSALRAELGEELRELGLPTLLVTHDYGDAAALANRIGVLVDGQIAQLGTPAELVASPVSPFVAEFTGVNFLRGTAVPGPNGLSQVRLVEGGSIYSTDVRSGRVGVIVFPWEITLARSATTDSARNHLTGLIRTLTPIGNRVRVSVGPLTAEITAASAEQLELLPGEQVVATFKAAATRLVPLTPEARSRDAAEASVPVRWADRR